VFKPVFAANIRALLAECGNILGVVLETKVMFQINTDPITRIRIWLQIAELDLVRK